MLGLLGMGCRQHPAAWKGLVWVTWEPNPPVFPRGRLWAAAVPAWCNLQPPQWGSWEPPPAAKPLRVSLLSTCNSFILNKSLLYPGVFKRSPETPQLLQCDWLWWFCPMVKHSEGAGAAQPVGPGTLGLAALGGAVPFWSQPCPTSTPRACPPGLGSIPRHTAHPEGAQ